MPVFEIGLDDGRKLRIEADDQDAALAGVAHFTQNSGAPAAPEQTDSTAADVAKSAGTGLVKGTAGLAGFVGDAAHLLGDARDRYISNPVSRALGLPEVNLDAPDPAEKIGSQSILNGVEKATGPLHAPQTTAGKYAESVASFLPGVVGGPEGLASRLLTRAVAPGVASEAAGQATEGTAAEPYARMGAAVLGGTAASRLAAARSAAPLQAMPTLDEVNAEKTRLYNDPSIKDLRVAPQAVSSAASRSMSSLVQDGFRDHPDYGGPVLDILRDAQRNTGPVAFDDLETMRKAMNKIAGEVQPNGRPTTNAAAAMKAKSHIDDFVDNQMLNPANVLQGNPLAARAAIKEARATAGAAARSESVLNTLGNAEVNAAAANSGHNVENRIRQAFKPLLKNDEAKMAGYSDEQRELVNKLVRGTYATDALRTVANMTSRTGHIGLGVALMHPATAIPAALAEGGGWAMKQLANKMAISRATKIADKLLADAPMSQRVTAANAPIQAANSAAARRMMMLNAMRAAALSQSTTKE